MKRSANLVIHEICGRLDRWQPNVFENETGSQQIVFISVTCRKMYSAQDGVIITVILSCLKSVLHDLESFIFASTLSTKGFIVRRKNIKRIQHTCQWIDNFNFFHIVCKTVEYLINQSRRGSQVTNYPGIANFVLTLINFSNCIFCISHMV